MRFPVHHCGMLQDSTVGRDSIRGGMTGAGGTHAKPSTLAQYIGHPNTTQAMSPAYGYPISGLTWAPQLAPPHRLAQIDIIPRADPGSVQYGSVIPQLSTDMFALQIGNGLASLLNSKGVSTYVARPRPGYPDMIHAVPITAEATVSPDGSYQHYSQK